MKISDIFDINQGHQITDEEIYNSFGNIPIYTGNNDIKGYWNKSIVNEDSLPCLTYPTKGYSGKIYIQDKIFDANNTAILTYKKDKKDIVELEYVRTILEKEFLKYMTSRENISYLNREIVENIEIDIPPKNIRKKIINISQRLNDILFLIDEKINAINNLKKKQIILNENIENSIPFNKIFSYISRNDSLSEQGLYNLTSYIDKSVHVLCGGSENIFYGKISKDLKNIHYLMNKQCIHLVTRGKAGKLTYMQQGNYATNTNAFLLYIDDNKLKELNIHTKKQEEIYLKYFTLYLQSKFYKKASLSDLGVFPLTDVMENYMIPNIQYNSEMDNIVEKYEKLNNILDTLHKYKEKISNLLIKTISF